ncbi:MAG: hypothetical protein HZB16_07555 [Armatimonadetes bacterium]|nr:hypothetical protein [Armatimonadota bacterium]
MARTVLHVELPGVHVAAAVELGLVSAESPVVVYRDERVLDLSALPWLRRGQALRQAQRLAPAAEFVPAGVLAGAETYRAAWDELLRIGPSVEPTAWHAGYVEVTGCLPKRGVNAHLAALAGRLQAVTQQPPAQGVSVNKLIARHASQWGKVVGASEAVGFLHEQRLRPSAGLTAPMIELLDELGCHRWSEVSEVPEPRLRALFGVRGTLVHRWSQGVDPRPVKARYPPPVETARALLEPEQREAWLGTMEQLVTTLSGRLKRRGELATEVVLALGLRAGSGPGLRRNVQRVFRRRLARGIDSAPRLSQIVLGLLPMDIDPLSIEEIRLTLRGLRSAAAVQGVLFLDEREERSHLLDGALSRVRSRYGLSGLGYVPEMVETRQRLAEAIWDMEEALR